MGTSLSEVALDPPHADPAGALEPFAALPAPRFTHEQLLWVARAGRLAIVWLPIWIVCIGHLGGSLHTLAVSVVLTLVWKVALRRAYADTSVTMWTFGAQVASAVGSVSGALIALLLGAAVPPLRVPGPGIAEIAGAVFVASFLWEPLVAHSVVGRCRLLVVGASGAGELVDELAQHPRLPFDVVGIVDDARRGEQIAGVPVLGSVDELAQIAERARPELVVLADDSARASAIERLIDVSHVRLSAVALPQFYEYAFGRLPVRKVSPEWFMTILDLYRRPYSQLAKRTFDVIVAATALVLVSPILAVVALVVRRTPGPVIYRQRRLGEHGRFFTIYKFRTMREDAETDGAAWASEGDPRITPAGAVLRRTRLDELPQLWNVLKGEMSVVGPRPERPEFLDELRDAVPFWTRRHLVKPGITGWAQIRRGYTADASGTADKLAYDLWYLRHRSLLIDLCICAKTFSTLLTGSGAR